MASCPHCGRELGSAGFSYCPWCAAPLLSDRIEQRRTVTVVIADLVGSTALGSTLDPEVLHEIMRAYRDTAAHAVARHGGTVSKFIGDALVGIFGAASAHEDDAVRAVRASTEMLARIEQLNVDLERRLGVQLAIRVGINTGAVLLDQANPDAGLLVGDVANVAARLEQSARPGEIRVGESTAVLIRDDVDLAELPLQHVKGKPDPLPAYLVRGVRPLGELSRRRRFSAPLVGRAESLADARAVLADAQRSRCCRVLTVTGEPGVGKSRLVDELLNLEHAVTLVLRGRCLPYGEGATYWPVMQMLQQLRDQMPWSERLAGVPHSAEIADSLDAMLGSSDPPSGSDISWAFRRLLESLAADQPIAVVFDDLQWASEPLLDLIIELDARLTSVPVLLICVARTELLTTHPEWGHARPAGRVLPLEPLSAAGTDELLSHLLGTTLDAQARTRIAAAAQGVPLFVEELAAAISVHGPERVEVPPTIHALLTARLDGLQPDESRVLEAAAVIGQTFYPEAMQVMLGGAPSVSESLAVLRRQDLVRPAASDLPDVTAYAFNHLLVRDCAYEAIPLARRAALHLEFARWLERNGSGSTQPELVASRLERAARYRQRLGRTDATLDEEAGRHMILCANRARLADDMTGATRLLERAADLVDHGSASYALIMLARSEVDEKAANWTHALDWAQRAQSAATDAHLDGLTWRARLQVESLRSQTDPTMDVAEFSLVVDTAIDALMAFGDDQGLARAIEMQCDLDNYRGQHGACGARARLGLEAARRSGDVSATIDLMRHRMMPFYLGMGTCDEENAAVRELEAAFGDDPILSREVECNAMILRTHMGELEEPREYFARQAALASEKGNLMEAISKHYWVIETLEWADDLVGSRETIALTISMLEEAGESTVRSTQWAELAMLEAREGLDDEARHSLNQSHALAQGGDYIDWVLIDGVEGLLAARQGDRASFERHFTRAREALADTDSWYGWRSVLLAESLAAEALGDRAGALTAAQELLDLAEVKQWQPALRVARARVEACQFA